MNSLRHPKPILPWWQLGLMILGCVLGIWWLLPGDEKLIEDLIKDGQYDRALERLRDVSPLERKTNQAYYQSLELKLSRLEIPLDASSDEYNQWWQIAVNTWRASKYATDVFAEILPIIPRLPDPQRAWQIAADSGNAIPPDQYMRLARRLSDAALATDQPRTSALLYAIGHPPKARSEIENLELARRWQFAGDPQNALHALDGSTTPEATLRRISLLRALNRNQEAVVLIRERIRQANTSNPHQSELEELATVALAAGIPGEAIPEYQKFASDHPDDLLIQRRLRDLMVSAGQIEKALPIARHIVGLSDNAPDDLRSLARLSEYAGQSAEAFDQWLKMAELTKDTEAIDRLFDLNPGLYRDADLAKLLRKVVPVEGHPDYTLATARIMENLGFYFEAEKYYADYLAIVPEDASVAQQLATLHYEMFEYHEAEKWYRHASALRPHDVSLRMAVADAVILENRPDDAFEIYRKIMIDFPTDEVLEQYIRVAESMGRYHDLAKGLREQISREATPSLSSYEKLAYTYGRLNDTDQREQILREGLTQYPNNTPLKIQFAQILIDRKEYRPAQQLLSTIPELHSDLTAALLYLDLMRLNNNTAAEEKYLATAFAKELRENEPLLKRVARAYEALQQYEAAEAIWRKLLTTEPNDHEKVGQLSRVLILQGKQHEAYTLLAPFLVDPSPAILKLAAEVALVSGDYLNAEQYQLEYLKTVKKPRATDWGALGDIRLSRGDKEGALRAYQTGNRLMIARLLRAGESTITKETLINRADTLSLDDRHYLLYLSARVHDAQTANGLADHILANNPSDRQTLLVLASMALEKRDARETLRLARVYLSYYPDDYQGLYFLGTGHFLAKEYHLANAVLRKLKQRQFKNRKYPFETDLAASALASGDWYRAMLSYQELLRHHVLSDELRSEVRDVLDSIYREHGRRVEFTSHGTRLNLAQVRRYTAMHAAHLSNRNWLELLFKRDDVELEAAPGLQAASRPRDQIAAKLSRNISSQWKGDLSLGSYGDGVLGSASLRYLFAQQREVSWEQTINDRAVDSLGLEALDGRESRTTLNLRWLIEADLTANLRVHTRAINIDGDRLGQSTGADLNVDYVLRRHGPHISVGYRGSHATFSPESITTTLSRHAGPIADPLGGQIAREAVISNLVSRRLNRHGGGLYITDNIADAWVYRLTLGTDYDFELSSLGWNGNFALSFFPRKSIELSAETGYTSSATDSNAGSAATLTNLLFRFYY